jgi:transcriptional regulator with XRE-family HTH domain
MCQGNFIDLDIFFLLILIRKVSMDLNERIRLILKERNVKQVDFAKTLGITANYANQLATGRKTAISEILAKLIEDRYGYAAQWVMDGIGERYAKRDVSNRRQELIDKINRMSQTQVNAVLAYVRSLEELEQKPDEQGGASPEDDFPLVPRYPVSAPDPDPGDFPLVPSRPVPAPAPDSAPASAGIEEDEAAG